MAHRKGVTLWGQAGKAFFESSGYWPLFSAWVEGVVHEIPAGFFEHDLFRNGPEGGGSGVTADVNTPVENFDGVLGR